MLYNSLCAFMTATDTELSAQQYLFDWQEFKIDGDEQVYYKTDLTVRGKSYPIVMAKQNEMGMVGASFLASKLIMHFKPKYLIMTGISAGIKAESAPGDEQEFGDVIVADMVWNYTSGKYVSSNDAIIKFGKIGFSPRPIILKIDEDVRQHIDEAIESEKNECHVRFGSMACGFGVVANAEYVDTYIRSQYRETSGLDMESYAVMYAARNAVEPRPKAIVIKSICDFADGRKDDRYQRFAAYTSTEFAKQLLESFLPIDDCAESRISVEQQTTILS